MPVRVTPAYKLRVCFLARAKGAHTEQAYETREQGWEAGCRRTLTSVSIAASKTHRGDTPQCTAVSVSKTCKARGFH